MILSDRDIRARLAAGDVAVEPMFGGAVQPSSVEVRLGTDFLAYLDADRVDPTDDETLRMLPIPLHPDGSVVLRPGQFVLGHTMETITLPGDIAGRVEGKSSLGRAGLAVHVTAGFIDPGFSGSVVLELVNFSGRHMVLRPGMVIGQLCLIQMSSPAEIVYGDPAAGSHYNGQSGVRGPSAVRIPIPEGAPCS